MLDNSNYKYIIIALAIALIVLLFLYFTKSSRIDNMKSISSMLNIDYPWADEDEGQYRSARKMAVPTSIMRKDKIIEKYLKGDTNKNADLEKIKKQEPKPMDEHPELGQCQPCVCDCESDSDIIYIKARKKRY